MKASMSTPPVEPPPINVKAQPVPTQRPPKSAEMIKADSIRDELKGVVDDIVNDAEEAVAKFTDVPALGYKVFKIRKGEKAKNENKKII